MTVHDGPEYAIDERLLVVGVGEEIRDQ